MAPSSQDFPLLGDGEKTSLTRVWSESVDASLFKTALILLHFSSVSSCFRWPSSHRACRAPFSKAYGLRHHLRVGNDPMEFMPLSLFPLGTKIEFSNGSPSPVFFSSFFIGGVQTSHTGPLVSSLGLFFSWGFLNPSMECFSFSGVQEMRRSSRDFCQSKPSGRLSLNDIPLGIGFLFSVETSQVRSVSHWLHRLSFLDGKTSFWGSVLSS